MGACTTCLYCNSNLLVIIIDCVRLALRFIFKLVQLDHYDQFCVSVCCLIDCVYVFVGTGLDLGDHSGDATPTQSWLKIAAAATPTQSTNYRGSNVQPLLLLATIPRHTIPSDSPCLPPIHTILNQQHSPSHSRANLESV